jgi:O-antigen/teichoic acid export membrane protein
MDVGRDHDNLRRAYRTMLAMMATVGAVGGILYAMFGATLVGWWLGADRVPSDRQPFVWAGAAVAFLCVARIPISFAYALAKLRGLASLLTLELIGKIALFVWLLPHFGFVAPVMAICMVHLCGLALAYQFLGAKVVRTAT